MYDSRRRQVLLLTDEAARQRYRARRYRALNRARAASLDGLRDRTPERLDLASSPFVADAQYNRAADGAARCDEHANFEFTAPLVTSPAKA